MLKQEKKKLEEDIAQGINTLSALLSKEGEKVKFVKRNKK